MYYRCSLLFHDVEWGELGLTDPSQAETNSLSCVAMWV